MIASPTNGNLDFVIVLLSPTKTDTHSLSNNHDKVIGKVGIWSATESEIGFMLSSAYWKQGYMAEALTALLGPDGVFWERGVEWVVADVDPRNDSCIGILTKFGFVETGRREKTLETHMGWCDSVYFELRKEAVKGGS